MRNYKKQIYLFLYVSLFIVIGSFAVLFFNFRKQVSLQNEILKIEANLSQADSLTANLLQIESDKRGFQLTSDVNYLKNFYALKVNSNANAAKLKKNIIAGADKEIISQIDSLLKLRIANLDSGIFVFTTKGFEASIAFMQIKGKKNIRELLNQNLDLLKNNLLKKLQKNTAGINKRSDHNLTGLLIILLIFILLMLVAARTFRRSQQKIIKTHTKFKQAQRIAKIGSWEWDFATNKLTWSQEQFRLFGETRKKIALTYEDYLSHLSAKEQENTKALLKDALEGKANYAVEHEIIRKNGTTLMVFEQGSVLFDEDNKPTGMFGTTQDITERKRLEESLEKEKYFLDALMDNMPEAIYFKDKESKLMRVSKFMADRFGTSMRSLIGKSDFDFQSEIHAKEAYDDEQNIQKTGKPRIDYIEKEIGKDGSETWVSTTKMPLIDPRGEVVGTFGISRDITNRKLAEITLNNSEKRYRQIVETAQEGIWMLDENNYTIFVNKKMCEMLEYTKEEMMGKQNYYFKDEEGKKKAMQDIERRKTGKTETQTSKFIAKSGKVVWTSLSTNPIFDEEGKYVGALGMFTDITDRRLSEEKINAERQLMRTLIDNIPDPIYIKDLAGRKIMANKVDMLFMGIGTEAEFLGKTDLELFPNAGGEQGHKNDMAVIMSGEPVINKTEEFIDIKGVQRWLLTSKIPLYNAEKNLIGLLGVGRDITKRRKAETELVEAKKKFQSIFDNTADGIYQSTAEGKFITANPAVARIFGYDSPAELISSMTDIGAQLYANPADRKRMAELLSKQDHVENFEAPLLTKKGDIVWVSESTRAVRDEKGAIKYYEGTLKDISERKKAEKKVADFMFALDQSSIVDVSDLNGEIQFVNENFCRISGYSSEELKGQNHRILKSGYHSNEHYKNLWETVLNGKVWRCEVRNKAKDGSFYWTDTTIVPFVNEDGKPFQFVTIRSDITERKKAEEELALAQMRYQEIFDNTADGIYQSTVDGKFIMANPSMARIFGYDSPEDLIHTVTDIGSQIYANPVERKKMAQIILAEGHVEDYELQVLTKKKDIIWVSANIRVVKDDQGAISYFEGVLEDISERKKSEEQLLNLSNRLQLALRATSIGIWDWDVVTNANIWDDEMYRIYNVNPKDPVTISQAWEAAVHPEDLERVTEELTLAIRGVKEYDTEFRAIWKDKTIHHVKGNALVLKDQSGNPLRMIGTNTDITQRKEAENEILQLNKNLDQFANITAHDLQEPIRMVSGFLGLLEKKYNDVLDEQGKSYVFRAKDGADRMSILIRDLLEFSRSGNKSAKKEPVDLNQVIDLVNKDMSIVMTDTGASLHVPPCLPVITGTQSALYRLFLNLTSNGIKFRKKDTAPEVCLSVKELSDFWEFSLQDNGIGIKEEDQPKLFNAFQRLHRREEYPGTGLGLVTCKKIVEVHGGKIWITSEYGKGTAFHFTLPKTQ